VARLHLRYRAEAFDPRILELTRRFMQMKPWRSTDPSHLFITWLHGACIIYGLPEPRLTKINDTRANRKVSMGEYRAGEGGAEDIIVLRRWSMTSLFHQFRHHMENYTPEGALDMDDAQAWATSLFYVLAPRHFRRMVRAERIAQIKAHELLRRRRPPGATVELHGG
jgi:hypothetical protein